MNGTAASLAELDAVKAGIGGATADVAICPPATLIAQAADKAKGSALMIGGQDCHPKANGAHTGDISAEMIADAGGKLVIVGHSERRADHKEGNELVRAEGRGRLAGRAPGHPLHRRDRGGAEGRGDQRGPVDGSSPARCRKGRPRPTW